MSIASVQFVSLGEVIQFVSVGEPTKVSILCLKNIVIKILQSLWLYFVVEWVLHHKTNITNQNVL